MDTGTGERHAHDVFDFDDSNHHDEVVTVEDLHVRYGETIAVDGVSFSVRRGEIFGILGPNGAGKTTTVECIGGLRTPDRGRIAVLGLDPRHDRDRVRDLVGIQLQESGLPDKLRVLEALELFATFYTDPADPESLLALLGLAEKRSTRFADLSGGQRQRLSIALALVGRPRVAILDELTTGLDPAARRETWSLVERVREEGVTVLLVTHFMDEAQRLCDRVALIDHGRLLTVDTPAGLAGRSGSDQRVSFVPSAPVRDEWLLELGEVNRVEHRGGRIEISGTGNLVGAVARVLILHGIAPDDLRVEQSSLEDAFVALTHPTVTTEEVSV
jgi:ABC-2 type transport system ATP-binding protein